MYFYIGNNKDFNFFSPRRLVYFLEELGNSVEPVGGSSRDFDRDQKTGVDHAKRAEQEANQAASAPENATLQKRMKDLELIRK